MEVEDLNMEHLAPKIYLDDAHIPVYRVFTPSMDVNKSKKFIAYQGSQSSVWSLIQATSKSTSQLTWQINTPSVRTGINRQMYVELTIQATAQDGAGAPGTAGNPLTDANLGTALSSSRLGVRPLPFQSSVDTASLDLNSSRFSWNPRQIVNALYSFNTTDKHWDGYYSSAGGLPEQFSTYNAGADPANTFFVASGLARNPLQYYGNNVYVTNRGISNYNLSKVGVNTGTFQITICEPLLIPPLTSGTRDSDCLYGINNLNLNFVMSNIERIFAVGNLGPGAAGVFSSILPSSISIIAATLHIQYNTFNLTYKLPRTPVWSCHDILNFRKDITLQADPTYTVLTGGIDPATILLSANGSARPPPAGTHISSSISLSQIPKYIYVFAKRRVGNDNPGTTESFLRITRISVDFNNRSGLLSSLSEYDLYALNVKNGYNRSFVEMEYVGLPLCLSTAEDLSLSDDQAPGCIGQYNLQITVDFAFPQSWSSTTATGLPARYPIVNNFDLFVVVINEGACWVSPSGILQTKFGMLTENVILSAEIEYGTYEKYTSMSLMGGSFFGKLNSFVNKAAKTIESVAPVVGNVANALSPALANTQLGKYSGLLSKIGDYSNKANEYAGVARKATGGAKYINKETLRKRMMNL